LDPKSTAPGVDVEAEKSRPFADAVLNVIAIGVPIEDWPAVVAAVMVTGFAVIDGATERLRLTLATCGPSGPVTVTEPVCVPAAIVAIFGTDIKMEPGVIPEEGDTFSHAAFELAVKATPLAGAVPCVPLTATETVGTTVVPAVPTKLTFDGETETTGAGGALMVR
jgi:hypothetical protein